MDRRELYRQVARLHIGNIDQGFLSTLGEPFVALMYRAIDESPGSVLFVEAADGRVIGFVSGGRGMGSIYRQMLRYPLQLAVALLPSAARPARLRRIAEILRYSRGQSNPPGLPDAELLSIAVDPAWRGKDSAGRLYRRLAGHFRTAGEPAFKITVGAVLAPAHRFYQRMGAIPTAQVEVHEGESSTVYVQRIDRSADDVRQAEA